MHNAKQLEATADNLENRRGTVEKSPPATVNYPKTHVNFWRQRLRRQGYGSKADGTYQQCQSLMVRIHHQGRSHAFTFHSLNETACATRARDLYLQILQEGWDAVLGHHRSAPLNLQSNPTVGQFLTEISEKSGLRDRTFRNYANCFRTILSGIFGIRADKSKFDYRSGGTAKWREKVDAIRLGKITPEKVQKWKVAFIRAAGDSPSAQQSAKRTVNSYIRCSRSLFSSKTLKFLRIELPALLPFAGVELEKSGSMRYSSTLDVQKLIEQAREELKINEVEAYKIFLLGLFAGLRRAEIDGLEWSAIDWQNHSIRVNYTDVLHVKADGSAATVAVDQELLVELKELSQKEPERFVVTSHLRARPGSDLPYYRCEHHFKILTDWLRTKGVKANKPLHELRKELGALIASKHGIFAAAHVLRHSDISTTARHYADQKHRVTVGLGKMLLSPGLKSESASPGSPSKSLD